MTMQRFRFWADANYDPASDGEWCRVADAAGYIDELNAEIESLKALSVTNIMLDVVPGDGDGQEVYAKSVAEVEETLGSMGARIEDLESDWQLLSEQHDNTARNCSAFENEMGNLQVANGKLASQVDTLRDILKLLAPDLKAMAILYQQQGDFTRAQALNNICKSVGV